MGYPVCLSVCLSVAFIMAASSSADSGSSVSVIINVTRLAKVRIATSESILRRDEKIGVLTYFGLDGKKLLTTLAESVTKIQERRLTSTDEFDIATREAAQPILYFFESHYIRKGCVYEPDESMKNQIIQDFGVQGSRLLAVLNYAYIDYVEKTIVADKLILDNLEKAVVDGVFVWTAREQSQELRSKLFMLAYNHFTSSGSRGDNRRTGSSSSSSPPSLMLPLLSAQSFSRAASKPEEEEEEEEEEDPTNKESGRPASQVAHAAKRGQTRSTEDESPVNVSTISPGTAGGRSSQSGGSPDKKRERIGACIVCNQRRATSKCAQCRTAAYCSVTCAAHHWNTLGHDTECVPALSGLKV